MDKWNFHRRATRGGEDFLGHHFTGGEFLPFYVPRPIMPQIEEEDYPDFIEFAAERGVEITVRFFQPTVLRPHQRIDRFHAESLPVEVRNKTVFISVDMYILDGNHRWMLHAFEHTVVPCFEIKLPFEDAIALMFDFPKTHTSKGTE